MSRSSPQGPVLILGCGFLGQVLAQKLAFAGVPVIGTARAEPQLGIIRTRGATALRLDGDPSVIDRLPLPIARVLMAIPPEANLDEALAARIAAWGLAPGKVVYVSSTSVYGDHGGAVVVEATPVAPATDKARMRVLAEDRWRAIGASVIRPAGIYGPGRSLLHRIAAGRHRLIDGGLAITNRIHVADLATLCEAAWNKPQATLLGADTTPATQREVAEWCARELGLPMAASISSAEARVRMDKDTFQMFAQSKRLDPSWTLQTLAVKLRYPSWREGFRDLWAREKVALTALVQASA